MTTLVTSTRWRKSIASQGYDEGPLEFEWQGGPSVFPSMHIIPELIANLVDDNWALFGDSVMAESYSIHSSGITFAQIKA